jgi:peptidoglycan-N-acetylglucosamine deacetylase
VRARRLALLVVLVIAGLVAAWTTGTLGQPGGARGPGPAPKAVAPVGQLARAVAGAAGPVHLPPADGVYEETGNRAVGITFDDGPDPTWTPQVLAVLRQHHVRAVFCMVGFRVRAHPELVRQVVADGHALCNHTVDHDPTIGRKSVREIERNLRENNELITRASGGVAPRYFRAPHGDFTPRLVQVAHRLGLASLGWRVTSSDWQDPLMQPAAMANWVGRTVRPGSIVLFHDAGSPGTHWHTVAGLRLILADLAKRHWPTAVF